MTYLRGQGEEVEQGEGGEGKERKERQKRGEREEISQIAAVWGHVRNRLFQIAVRIKCNASRESCAKRLQLRDRASFIVTGHVLQVLVLSVRAGVAPVVRLGCNAHHKKKENGRKGQMHG